MEWVLKFEAKSGWKDVETIKVDGAKRGRVGLKAVEVRLTWPRARICSATYMF
jgi:hypothetical protein